MMTIEKCCFVKNGYLVIDDNGGRYLINKKYNREGFAGWDILKDYGAGWGVVNMYHEVLCWLAIWQWCDLEDVEDPSASWVKCFDFIKKYKDLFI